MKVAVASVLFAFFGPTFAVAQDRKPLSLDAQEEVSRAENAIEELKKLEALADGATREKKDQCIRSFGDETFCNCISLKTAIILSFAGYVAVTSQDRSEIKYETLSDTDKKIVDAARNARDECVSNRQFVASEQDSRTRRTLDQSLPVGSETPAR